MYSVNILVFEDRNIIYNRATGLYSELGDLLAEYLAEEAAPE